jgi:hypothetical protein
MCVVYQTQHPPVKCLGRYSELTTRFSGVSVRTRLGWVGPDFGRALWSAGARTTARPCRVETLVEVPNRAYGPTRLDDLVRTDSEPVSGAARSGRSVLSKKKKKKRESTLQLWGVVGVVLPPSLHPTGATPRRRSSRTLHCCARFLVAGADWHASCYASARASF